ncbi:TIGR03943 family protein [Ammoniphilus sp. CFH 90114]|uniref:TIGR03943 family putative permease subunit n=1 Tax=Ammoniphilus sp. CFH 90114 TaxID=2493665 RepID=UPI00100DB591|nr:TIGR03943 family protein [Ammoniphilus sp. CFH 90114]RXT04131.1 TIGR03943 family protein [Ammoniphilus sp. CFH 90114]
MNIQHVIRTFILFGFAALIAKLHLTGDLGKYINVKYSTISLIALAILSLLFVVQLTRIKKSSSREHPDHDCGPSCDHSDLHRWSIKGVLAYLLLLSPILSGFILPPKTLDASMAAKKGVLMQTAGSMPSPSFPDTQAVDPSFSEEEPSILYFDDLYTESLDRMLQQPTIVFNDFDYVEYADTISFHPYEFIGKEVEMTGFVYREEGMAFSQLVIARFIITHCIADAGVIGFLAEWEGADTVQEDSWVKVKGTIEVTQYGDYELPFIQVSEWEIVEPPADPYVYPKLN